MASKRRAMSTHPLSARTSKGITRLVSRGNCRTDLSAPGLTSNRRRGDPKDRVPSTLSCTRRTGSAQHAVQAARQNAPKAASHTAVPRWSPFVGKRMWPNPTGRNTRPMTTPIR
jgi:hypothetical protein